MNIKTKIVTALTLAVLVVPGISLAQTMSVAQLQAEIHSLTAQLQSLEAQLAAQGGSTTTAWCYTFNTNLRIGMSGQAVTELQTALQKDGETVTVNGSFDDQTVAAVTSFQEKHQSSILAPYSLSNGTGYAGKATRAELNSLFGCGTTNQTLTPTPTPISTNNSSVSLTVNGQRGSVPATSGSQITLAWTSSEVTNCTANSNGSWTGSVNTSGTSLVTLPSVVSETGMQYSLTCTTLSGGSVQGSVQVNVQPSGTTASSNGFTISPSVTTGFTQGGNNTISWNGGACPVGMPNSCVSLILENAQGSCSSPSVGTPCNVGFVPAPVNSPASGSFNWNAQTICASTASYSSTWANCTAVSPGLYRIFAQDYNGNLVSTGEIWINAATTATIPNAPSITITSPTVGQAWAAGTTQQITWTERSVNTGEYQIYLKDLSADGDSALTELAPSIPNGTNYFNWAIPSNISAGQYEMEVTSPETSVNTVSQPFSIIGAIVVPTSTPSSSAETIEEGRDAERFSDLITIKSAIALYAADTAQPSYACANTKTIYASASITPPAGWKAGANMGNTANNGTGWLPINFESISSGAPILRLPVDPVNNPSQHLVYLFACNPVARTYQLDAVMESQKFSRGGMNDIESADGGSDPNVYEIGSDMTLIPNNFWGQ